MARNLKKGCSALEILLSSSDPNPLFFFFTSHSLLRVRVLHGLLLTTGLASHRRFLSNHLLNLYSRHHLPSAILLFPSIPSKNTVSYNILLSAHLRSSDLPSALRLFSLIPSPNVTSFNSLLSASAQLGFNKEAAGLFQNLVKLGFLPDEFSFGSVLRACAHSRDVVFGEEVHGWVVKTGFQVHCCVGSSLGNMYMCCGRLGDGDKVFDGMPVLNLVSYNTRIAGRVQNGDPETALVLFLAVKKEGLRPDEITFTGVLTACSELATLGQGQQVHGQIVKVGVGSVLAVRSSLVSMYSKCGCLDFSVVAFSEFEEVDYVLWSAMISAFGFHGRGKEAVEVFEQMVREGTKPNEIIFLNLLYACSHSGLKEKGEEFFEQMREVYNLEPRLEHYTCIVDLLGRSGYLEKAEELIKTMPINPDSVIWKTLLSPCKTHRNLKMAKRVAEHVLELDPYDSAAHVLLSQIHATKQRWNDVSEVREHMKTKKVRKEPGMSWVEVRNKVHQFSMGDMSHPEYEDIHCYLRELMAKMSQCGYVPDITAVLHDMEDEEKEFMLAIHSEKLAVAYALLRTPKGGMIRVMKNLRVCSDCHVAIKFMSSIADREIVVRDVSRFHHFKNGVCSCGDYW